MIKNLKTSAEWKTHLTIKTNFVHSRSDNSEMTGFGTGKITEELCAEASSRFGKSNKE